MQDTCFDSTVVSMRKHWRGYNNLKHLVVLYALRHARLLWRHINIHSLAAAHPIAMWDIHLARRTQP